MRKLVVFFFLFLETVLSSVIDMRFLDVTGREILFEKFGLGIVSVSNWDLECFLELY